MKRVHRQGTWWSQHDDGSWVRWDEPGKQWVGEPTGPPAATPEEQELEERIAVAEHEKRQAEEALGPGSLEPLSAVGKWSRGLLLLIATLSGLAIALDFTEWIFVDRLERGHYTTVEAAESAGTKIDLAWLWLFSVPTVLAFLALLIPFLRWFSRAYENLARMNHPRSFSKGWAIGAWFVPILNLFRPKQIADEIWRGSHSSVSVPAFVHWWWACWITATITDRISGRLGTDSIGEWKTSIIISGISSIGFIAAAMLLRRYIKEVTRAQEAGPA